MNLYLKYRFKQRSHKNYIENNYLKLYLNYLIKQDLKRETTA